MQQTINSRHLGIGGFLGADFSSAPSQVDLRRLAECKNLWHDYASHLGGYLESFPGVRAIAQLSGEIFGIFSFQPPASATSFLVVHAGDTLYTLPVVAGQESVTPTPVASGLSRQKSAAFTSDGYMGILDGKTYRLLSYSPMTKSFSLTPARNLYIPTTFLDGVPYEQRNALSTQFKEEWTFSTLSDYIAQKNTNLVYQIISRANRTCRVVGCKSPTVMVHIPACAIIDGESYRITAVGDGAFEGNNVLEHLTIEEGVESLGENVALRCRALREVSLPSTLLSLGKQAFYGCERLTALHIGGVKEVGESCFDLCTSLTDVTFGGTKEEWQAITFGEHNTPLTTLTPHYENAEGLHARCFRLTVHEMCGGVVSVLLGGNELCAQPYQQTTDTHFIEGKTYYAFSSFRYEVVSFTPGEPISPNTCYEKQSIWYECRFEKRDGTSYLDSILIYALDARPLYQKTLTLCGNHISTRFADTGECHYANLVNGAVGEALHCATICSVFDGRVFLSGSSLLPSAVFYSQRDKDGHNHPGYFGICNYMEDGDSTPITAMTATATSLFVYKAGGEEGTVYCHTPENTQSHLIPRIYPAIAGAAGVGCLGDACNFADDTVFISRRGLDATEKSMLSSEKGISHRSAFVDARLRTEDLAHTRLVEWQGYLLLLCPNGHIYMADSRLVSRQGHGEVGYEWVYLEGIGAYRDDMPVYRFASQFPPDVTSCYCGEDPILLHEQADGIPYLTYQDYQTHYATTVISAPVQFQKSDQTTYTADAHFVIIQEEGGVSRYLVYTDGERTGGTFYGAKVGCAVGELLFLGTEDGTLLTANTDKRGPNYALSTGLSVQDIDRHHYHICHHLIESVAKTCADTAELPHLSKHTYPRGTVMTTKALSGGRIQVGVVTDQEDYLFLGSYTEGQLDFDDLDMDSLIFANRPTGLAVFREKTKYWTHKQYIIFSNEYQRPFGIGQISYRFRVKGRMKPQ